MSKRHFLDFEQPVAELESKIEELRYVQNESAVDISEEIDRLSKKSLALTKELYSHLTPWQVTQIARHPQRPYTLDYVSEIFSDFQELHGDRAFADDLSIVGGLARFNGQACMVLGHQKGRDTKERGLRNFGMSRPEGYRKALRMMKLAEKFGLPVFTFVDTPGAYPGIGAEERGQSEAIGRNIFEMAQLEVPIFGVLGDLARRLRVDPLEDRRACQRRGRGTRHHRASPQGARPGRQDRHRAGRRCTSRAQADGGFAQARARRCLAPGVRPEAEGPARAPL
jgi:acetyl-CoA carboxylase carboxyl transferase subunit alpha